MYSVRKSHDFFEQPLLCPEDVWGRKMVKGSSPLLPIGTQLDCNDSHSTSIGGRLKKNCCLQSFAVSTKA